MRTNFLSNRSRSGDSSLIAISLLSIVGATVFGTSVQAQQIEEEGMNELEEVIVQATRRDEKAMDVPISVSVIDTDTAISNGVTDINAIADFVPNLTAQDGGAPGLGNLVVRGIYAGGAPTVGTYIDDVPYGGVVGGFAASLALDASLYDLRSIEIVRGPQGTLFGASAVGGVVRYMTKDPDLEEIDGYVFGDYASTKSGSPSTLFKGRFSVPVVKDKFAMSISGYSQNAGGYVDDAITGEKDINDFDYKGGRLAAKWIVTDRFTLTASFMHHEADYDSAGYEDFDQMTGKPIFGDLQTSFYAPRSLDFDLWSITADIDLGFAMLTSVTSDQQADLVNESDVTPQLGPILPGTTIALVSGDDSSRFTQEFRLTSAASDSLEWIVGAYYTKQDSDSYQITVEDPPIVNLINLSGNQTYTEYAVFGNLTYYITPKWDITGGVRWSDSENAISQEFTGALSNPLLNDLETVTKDTVTTWLFSTGYQVNDNLNAYGRIASGYRPGGANLVVQLGDMVFGTPTYVPDDLWSYEAGIKGLFLNDRLSYDIGVYYIDWTDAQVSFTNPVTGLGETGNATGGIRAQGLEASISGELVTNLLITGTFSLSDTELKKDEPLLFGLKGESIPGIPDSTVSLAADYLVPLNSDVELLFGGTWRYTGGFESAFSQSATGSYDNPSYSQYDLRAGVNFKQFQVNLYAANIGNSSAYQTVFPVAPNFAYGVVLRPRTFGVNVRFNF